VAVWTTKALGGLSVWLSMTLAFAGCGSKSDSRVAARAPAGKARPDTVVVEGLLTGEIIECAAVRSVGGDVFALEDVPPPFDEWRRFVDERFMVVGEEIDAGRRGRYRTLRVLDMGLVLPPVILADPNRSNG
jgi:hypothetical protein